MKMQEKSTSARFMDNFKSAQKSAQVFVPDNDLAEQPKEQPKVFTLGNVTESVVINGNVGGNITNIHYHIPPKMVNIFEIFMKGGIV